MNTKEQIKNHIEYLGYRVEDKEDHLFCEKAGYANIAITVTDKCFRFWSIYNLNEIAQNNPAEFSSYMNTLNQSTIMTTFYYEKGLINFTALSVGGYNKQLFSDFVGCWETDTTQMIDNNADSDRFLGSLDEVAQSGYETNTSAYA